MLCPRCIIVPAAPFSVSPPAPRLITHPWGGCLAPRFLAADDMRPEISPYGAKYMHTPNMQSLADDGFVFRRMYVQQALCAPSRTVLLTGRTYT